MCPQPTILHLDSDQPAQLYMYQRILLFPLGRRQAQALVSLTTCMSDEHVSYKANLQQPAPNLGPLWARQRNAFRVVFFWRAESGPILRAY